jgi:hypothetical protein
MYNTDFILIDLIALVCLVLTIHILYTCYKFCTHVGMYEYNEQERYDTRTPKIQYVPIE